jgi:hypothetical protein
MGLEPVSVGIDDERGIVVGVVFGAHAGLAVVTAAGLQRSGMKGIDARPGWRGEAEMQTGFVVGRHRAPPIDT